MKNTQAIICAAGVGKRLFPLTKEIPKALLPFGRKTFLEHILDALSTCGVKKVIVVVGYKAETIEKTIGTRYGACSISYVYNDRFETTNNMYSLWCARNYVTDRMIFFNADTIFHVDILKNVLEHPHENIVNMSTPIRDSEDSMKIHLRDGRLFAIGKKIEVDAHGESFGFYKLSAAAAQRYFEIVTELLLHGDGVGIGDRGKGGYENASFVVPLERMAHEIPIIALSSQGLPWIEVDTHEDYERAQNIIDTIVG